MVPGNFFASASNNRNMLQIVFFSIFIGIGLILLPEEKGRPLLSLFESLNDVIIKLVDLIMYTAPIGVFALLANTIASMGGEGGVFELLRALGFYCIAVVIGLLIQTFITYRRCLNHLLLFVLLISLKG